MPRTFRIEPQAPLGQPPSYRASAAEFGGDVTPVVGEAGREIARTSLRGIDQLQLVQKHLQDADAQLDIATKMGALKTEFAQREAALRDSGVEPKDYAGQVAGILGELTQQTTGQLKYPGSASAFQKQAQGFMAEERVKAIHTGIKLQHAQIAATDDLTAREEAKTVVLGSPEEREAALESRFGRLTDYLRRGIYSAEQFTAKREGFLKDVEDSAIERDARSPDSNVRNQLIGFLRAGRYLHSAPGEQQRKADEIENRWRVEQERAATVQDRVRKEQAGAAEKDISDLVSSRDFEAAKVRRAEARNVLTPESYRQWGERIDKGEVKDTDPAVRNELTPLVYNASNDPRAVDERLRAYYAKGFIGDDDMKAWGGHLEVRINRLEQRAIAGQARRTAEEARTEARLNREQSDVEQRIRELTRVEGPAAVSLDTAARDTYNWALEDMHRNTPLYGGSERPMDWLKRNQATVMGRIGTVVNQRLRSIDQALRYKDPQSVGDTEQAVWNALRLLEANRGQFRRESDYLDQVRLLQEKQALIRERARFAAPAGGGGTPRPAAGAPREPSLGR